MAWDLDYTVTLLFHVLQIKFSAPCPFVHLVSLHLLCDITVKKIAKQQLSGN